MEHGRIVKSIQKNEISKRDLAEILRSNGFSEEKAEKVTKLAFEAVITKSESKLKALAGLQTDKYEEADMLVVTALLHNPYTPKKTKVDLEALLELISGSTAKPNETMTVKMVHGVTSMLKLQNKWDERATGEGWRETNRLKEGHDPELLIYPKVAKLLDKELRDGGVKSDQIATAIINLKIDPRGIGMMVPKNNPPLQIFGERYPIYHTGNASSDFRVDHIIIDGDIYVVGYGTHKRKSDYKNIENSIEEHLSLLKA